AARRMASLSRLHRDLGTPRDSGRPRRARARRIAKRGPDVRTDDHGRGPAVNDSPWLARDRAVLRCVLLSNARDFPDRPVLTFESGETWTSATALAEAARTANALSACGVGQDSRVAIMLPNGAEFVRIWWGTRLLGAAIMPLNPALKGEILAHPLRIAGP